MNEDLIIYCRGDRYAVTTDNSYIENKSQEAFQEACCSYFSQMSNLRFSENAVIKELKAYYKRAISPKRGEILMKTILIVDDDRTFLNLLAYALQEKKCEVFTATSVSEAKEILTKKYVSLICSDVHMKNETGFELLDYVRSEFHDLAFVLLSSDLTEENRIQAKVSDAYCLEKTEQDLVNRILQYEV